MVNSWIHVFMYFYYEMMVLRVRSFLNYKKFVTIMQIVSFRGKFLIINCDTFLITGNSHWQVQFIATIVHCTSALKKNCGYPTWVLKWLLCYMVSFLVLFIHFYIQTYWKPKSNKQVKKSRKMVS